MAYIQLLHSNQCRDSPPFRIGTHLDHQSDEVPSYAYCYDMAFQQVIIISFNLILSYLINLPGSLIGGHSIILSYRTSDLDLIKMDHYHI